MGKIMLNGKQYGVGGIEKAKDISYDNTSSGLSATSVQGALDEVKAGLSDYIIAEDFTSTLSVTASATSSFEVNYSAPSGYKFLTGFLKKHGYSADIIMALEQITNTGASGYARATDGYREFSYTITVLWVRNI